MECPFCDGEQKHIKDVNKENVKEHLFITLDIDNHFHVHGPVYDKNLIKMFILAIAKESGIEIMDEE